MHQEFDPDKSLLNKYHDIVLSYLRSMEQELEREIKRLETQYDKHDAKLSKEIENMWTVISGIRKNLDQIEKSIGQNIIDDLKNKMITIQEDSSKKLAEARATLETSSKSAERTAKIELTTSALEKAAWLILGGIIVWVLKILFESAGG